MKKTIKYIINGKLVEEKRAKRIIKAVSVENITVTDVQQGDTEIIYYVTIKY